MFNLLLRRWATTVKTDSVGLGIVDDGLRTIDGRRFEFPVKSYKVPIFGQLEKVDRPIIKLRSRKKGDKNVYRYGEIMEIVGTNYESFVDLTAGFFATMVTTVKGGGKFSKVYAIIKDLGKYEKFDPIYFEAGDTVESRLGKLGIQFERRSGDFDLENDWIDTKPNGKTLWFCEAFTYMGFFKKPKDMEKNMLILKNVIKNLKEKDSLIYMLDTSLDSRLVDKYGDLFNIWDKFAIFVSKFDIGVYMLIFIGKNTRKTYQNLDYSEYLNKVFYDSDRVGQYKLVKKIDLNVVEAHMSTNPRDYIENLNGFRYKNYKEYKDNFTWLKMVKNFSKPKNLIKPWRYVEEDCGIKFEDIKFLGRLIDRRMETPSDEVAYHAGWVEAFDGLFKEYKSGELSSFGNLAGLRVRYDKDLRGDVEQNIFEDLNEAMDEVIESYKSNLYKLKGREQIEVYNFVDVRDSMNMDSSVGVDVTYGTTMKEVCYNPLFVKRVEELKHAILHDEEFTLDASYNIIEKPHESLPDNKKKYFSDDWHEFLTARNILYQNVEARALFSCFTKDLKLVYNEKHGEGKNVDKLWSITSSGFTPSDVAYYMERYQMPDSYWYIWDVSSWDACLCFMLWIVGFKFYDSVFQKKHKRLLWVYYRSEIFKEAATKDGWLFRLFCYISTGGVLTGFNNSLINIVNAVATVRKHSRESYNKLVNEMKVITHVLGDDGLMRYGGNLAMEDFYHYKVGMHMKFIEKHDNLKTVRYLSHGYYKGFSFRELNVIFNKAAVIFGGKNGVSKYDLTKYYNKIYSYMILYWPIVEVRLLCVWILYCEDMLGTKFTVTLEREKDFVWEVVNYYNILPTIDEVYGSGRFDFKSNLSPEIEEELYIDLDKYSVKRVLKAWYDEMEEIHEYLPEFN